MDHLTDEQFREAHQPLQVPASMRDAHTFEEKVLFALADLESGSAEDIIRHLEGMDPSTETKPLVAGVHSLLASWYENGRIAANEKDGSLQYNLHKITRANEGSVDPGKLAPGLD